jgi:hypothetical protein
MITFKQFLEEQDPCWKGYRQLGTKKKNGKEVPNCIPIKEEKDSKQEANYQDSPKGDEYCEDCTMWREPNGCTAVEGKISPKGWCSYFEEKEEEEDEKEEMHDSVQVGDGFIIELKNIDIETTVVEVLEDGVVLSVDKYAAMRLEEAEYQGRDVPLNKPMLTPTGPKKRSVYVKNDKGNVVKVNFGDKNMTIKKHDPERRKSFRARHRCETPGPNTSARYWSCKMW